jgi:hypothetical protein
MCSQTYILVVVCVGASFAKSSKIFHTSQLIIIDHTCQLKPAKNDTLCTEITGSHIFQMQ